MNTVNVILVVILVLLLVGALPPLGLHTYGFWPSGGIGLVLLILIILILLGRI